MWDWNLPTNRVKAWDFLPHFLLRSYRSSYQHWVHWFLFASPKTVPWCIVNFTITRSLAQLRNGEFIDLFFLRGGYAFVSWMLVVLFWKVKIWLKTRQIQLMVFWFYLKEHNYDIAHVKSRTLWVRFLRNMARRNMLSGISLTYFQICILYLQDRMAK